MRLFTARVLRSAGVEGLEAASGAEAEAVARARRGTIDLLLTDVVMPGMTGRELAQRLQRLRRGIAVLYMSGAAAGIARARGVDARAGASLA